MGQVNIKLDNVGAGTITDVMYVPDISANLLSVNKLTEKNLTVVFDKDQCKIYKDIIVFVAESPIVEISSTMNGLNGHTNGDLNGCGDIITQNQQRGCWTIGLINSKYKYLTAETFGFKINANGASLKKKQIWTLEPDTSSGNDTCVYLKSHLDKYLAVDSFGNVTCESEEKEPGSKFQVTVAEDNTGRWAFRNVVRGYFLGSSADKLTCTAKAPGDSEYWHIHLAARPQVNLRSVGRKRFAHLSENLDEIHVDANIPWGEDTLFTLEFHADEDGKYALHTCNNKYWGEDTLFTLEFHADEDGKYALHTCNNKYLSNGGKLVDTCNKDCLFSAEYHSGQLALRDRNGQYLSPIGSKAVLKTRSNTVTKDELFSLEDSLPQASFVAALNSRYVSVKQGVDVTANQDEISDHEMFQLEFDWSTKRWYIRTMQDKYWTLETGGGIQASGDKRSSNALFDLVWQGDGSLAFRANNGRYVITKRSGHLYATSDVIDDNCKYYFYLINRPILVLKCEQGFVGYKSASSPKLECNKATYECIQVERSEKGIIHFKGQNGKYWHVDSEGVTSDSDTAEGFYLELREPTRLCIKAANGSYLTASKNGLFRLGDSAFENATQWEY
ncbi:Fascin domain [Popillia japonica]|uniref:Fascin domain n=1 Tax=Popillia japonica TaxID=7064 RepID=A0AAW1KPM2_POPJA